MENIEKVPDVSATAIVACRTSVLSSTALLLASLKLLLLKVVRMQRIFSNYSTALSHSLSKTHNSPIRLDKIEITRPIGVETGQKPIRFSQARLITGLHRQSVSQILHA